MGDWHDLAACQGLDVELWFPEHGDSHPGSSTVLAAKAVCRGCPVTRDCLVAALREERQGAGRHGIRGGLTARERLRLVKQWTEQQRAGVAS